MARTPATPAPQHPGGRNNRLDAFVDAAFAFAVTLLVISADKVPDSIEALRIALKAVPGGLTTTPCPCG